MAAVNDADAEDLVRRALDGLFAIASGDRPASVTASLRDQIQQLDPARRRSLVREMVDTDRLAMLLDEEADPPAAPPPGAPTPEAEKVDRALEPLARWVGGEEAARRLAGLPEGERARLLLASLAPR